MGLCLAYQLADRGGRLVPVVQRNPVVTLSHYPESDCHQKKGPSVFCCLPHFTETGTTRDRFRARTWRIGLAVPTFRMGYLRSITLTSARIKNSGRRIVSARLWSWGRHDVEWRAYVCGWAAWSVRNKEGDFVECGINRGGLSRAVVHCVNFERLNKQFWLLDTYQGLVNPITVARTARRRLRPVMAHAS
jgi:hypothetical protein